MGNRVIGHIILWISAILFIGHFTACNTTKKVPEGAYLLDKTNIKSDAKDAGAMKLKAYLGQKPNSSVPVLGKWKLNLYNIPDNDSTWFRRLLIKNGEPPVIYSEQLTAISVEQIRLHLNNIGYLNAEVDTSVVKHKKKAKVTYTVTGGDRYHIRSFSNTINDADTAIYNILSNTKKLNFVRKGDAFDLSTLHKGRENMTVELRNHGYYNFLSDNFYFLADTTVGNRLVDVTLGLNRPESSSRYKQYRIGRITVANGIDTDAVGLDTIQRKGINIVSRHKPFILPAVICYNTPLRAGMIYTDRIFERTYASLKGLGPVSMANISLVPVVRNDSDLLDVNITLVPGNKHFLKFGVDGTNSAGDLGIASDLSYEYRNLLHGGGTFRIQMKTAYEFINKYNNSNALDDNYYEYGGEIAFSSPQLFLPSWRSFERIKDRPSASTEFSASINFQKRPEYLRQFFSLSSRYQWSSDGWHLQHSVEPIGITFVRMPWASDMFNELYRSKDANPILRYSYDQQLIVTSACRQTYTNYNHLSIVGMPRTPMRVRTDLEVAGWLPRVMHSLGGGGKNGDGLGTFFKIPYSEYVKTDIDYSGAYIFDEWNTLAWNFAVGVGYPYGNSSVLPFEKRYFGGGANGVRGWSVRSLGPGTYNRDSVEHDFGRRVGDVKLLMSAEFRRAFAKPFELAAFVDAGNIWTIKDYVEQPGGQFKWNKFYKQLALSYGLGLRLDFKFILIRFDSGIKVHDPTKPPKERWSIRNPKFRRDFAFHFAIGYPF